MANKKTQIAVFSVVAVLLVAALILSLTAVMGANNIVYENDGNFNVNNTAVNTHGGEDGVAKDGTVAQKGNHATTGYTEIGGDSGKDFSYVKANPEGNYILMGNITLNDVDTATTFKGILDGNGYTITLDIENRSTNTDLVGGVFKTVDGGTIKNLTVLASKFIVGTDSNDTSCGVFAGSATGGALFSNVCVTLAWSPTNEGNGTSDFYFFQNTSRGKGAYIRLGGLLGKTQGDTTIEDTTVENVTTGNYGFSINGWRTGGNLISHSDGFHDLGGFVASAEGGGTVNLNRITFAGNASSKITIRNESTGSYRYNATKTGLIVGYMNNGTYNVNGFILSYPAVIDTNIIRTKMNYNDQTSVGIVVGWDGNSGGPISVSNMYFVEGASTDWISGKKNNIKGVNIFPASTNPRFDGTNIAFYGAKKVAPNSSELVAQISHAGQKQNVMTSLMLKEGESEETVWLSVPVLGITDGKNYTLDLSAVMANRGSMKLESSVLTMTGESDSAYTATKVYNGKNVESPVVALYDNASQKVTDITDVYESENSIYANATYTLTPNTDYITAAGYGLTVYGGVTYIYNETYGYVYLPDGGVQIGEEAKNLDINKNLEVEVTPAPVTVGVSFEGNQIIYLDSYDDILGKCQAVADAGAFYGDSIPVILSLALTTADGEYTQGMPAGTVVGVQVTAVLMMDGNENYEITYSEPVSMEVQKLVLNGSISGADDSEYDGLNHMDAVYSAIGYDFEYTYAYTSGGEVVEEVINAGNYSVSATCTDESVILENATKDFVVNPKTVVININEEVEKSHDYNGGVINEADLFIAPTDIDGTSLDLTFVTTLGMENAVIKHAGEYSVIAKLDTKYTNYTASDVLITYVVNKVALTIGTEQAPEKLTSVYDGEAMTQEEMEALFTAPLNSTNQPFALDVKANGNVLNAGTYTITADVIVPMDEINDYEVSQASVQFVVEQAVVGGSIVLPDNSVFDNQAKEIVFDITEGTLYGQDKLTLSYSKDGVPADSVKDAGVYTISVVLPEYEAEKCNYKWADGTATTAEFQVNAYEVSVTAGEAQSKVYDGEVFDDYASLFVLPEDLLGAPLDYDFTITKDGETVSEIKDAGVYTVKATLASGQTNYVSNEAEATYTIDKVVVEGSLVLDDMLYDGTEKTAQFVFAGESPMVGGDVISIVYGEGDRTNYGAAVSVTAQLPSDNYVFAQDVVSEGTIAVERIIVDGKLVFGDMTFDGKEKTAAFEFTGASPMVGGDVISIVYGEGDRTNVGAAVSVTAQLPSVNYVFAESAVTSGSIEVTPVEIVLDFGKYGTSASGLTIVIGEEFLFDAKIAGTSDNNVQIGENTYTYSVANNGWTDGDYTTEASVGETFTLSVTLTIDTLDNANYTYANAISLRVIATSMGGTLVASNDGVKYDGSAYGATLEGTVEGVEASDYQIEYALDGTDEWTTDMPVNAGTYKVRVVSLTADYSADQIAQITFTINKADAKVVVIADPEAKYFEGYALPGLSLNVELSTPGSVVWENADEKLIAGVHSYNWVFTSSDPNYNDATGSIELTAQAVVFDRIEVEKTENFKTNYVYGDTFYKDGIIVKAIYNDGSEVILTAEEYTVGELTTGATSVEVTYTLEDASVTVDGFVVDKKIVEKPASASEYVYNGSEQTIDIASNDLYDVTGETTGKNAGDYTLTATLKDSANYKWADSEEASIEIVWTIAKKSASITAEGQTIVYGESPAAFQAVAEGNIEGETLEYTVGVQNAPDKFVKGTYDIVITLTADSEVNANYDITLNNATLTVNAKTVEVPVVEDKTLTYNGEAQEYVIPVSGDYTVSGNVQTNAGSYVATVTLNDKENCVWSNGSSDDITFEWTIAKGTREINVSATLGYKVINVTVDDAANVEYSLDGKTYSALENNKISVDISVTYKVYFRYKETDNYLASSAKTVELKLTKAVLAAYINDSFGEEFTFADVDKYNAIKTLAQVAEGTSEEFDSAMAALDAKYNELIDNAKESVENALNAGATLAGRKVAVVATALTVSTVGVGVALAAMCIKVRKGGKKDEE